MKVKTIAEAHYVLMTRCINEGYKQIIQKGEFQDSYSYRIQLRPDRGQITITEPLNTFDLPKHITLKQIEDYHLELVNPSKTFESVYTYGSRMAAQLEVVMEMLRKTPETNQAIIEIANPHDLWAKHMPCLRLMHFIYIKGWLNLFVFIRSNDLSEAFLLNNYGFARVLKDVAEYAELGVGDYHYSCSCAHIYSHSLKNVSLKI